MMSGPEFQMAVLAVNMVDHNTLQRLENCVGLSGTLLKWSEVNLNDRGCFLLTGNYTSKNTQVTHGVPQGTVSLFRVIVLLHQPTSSELQPAESHPDMIL